MDISSKYTRLIELLELMRESFPEITVAALMDADGLMIASTLKTGSMDENLAAEGARLWDSALKTSDGLNLGKTVSTFLFSKNGNLLLEPVKNGRILVFILKKELQTPNLYSELAKYADSINKLDL